MLDRITEVVFEKTGGPSYYTPRKLYSEGIYLNICINSIKGKGLPAFAVADPVVVVVDLSEKTVPAVEADPSEL